MRDYTQITLLALMLFLMSLAFFRLLKEEAKVEKQIKVLTNPIEISRMTCIQYELFYVRIGLMGLTALLIAMILF